MSELALFLPFPPKELSPNGRPVLAAKLRVRREYEEQVGFAIAAQRPRTWFAPQKVRLNLAFFMCGRAAWDDDNAIGAFKAGRDQLIARGVIVDDGYRHCELGRVRVVHHRGPRSRVPCPAWCPEEGVLVVVRSVKETREENEGDLADYVTRLRRAQPQIVPWRAA